MMKDFVSDLLSNKLAEARSKLEDRLLELVEEKLEEAKKDLASEMSQEYGNVFELVVEANVMRMGRTKLVKVRVRKGKIQRRRKLSAVKGYTIRGGKLTRMGPTERRHRKMSAKRSKFKRLAKMRQALRKRKISNRKRTAMGL